MVDYEDYPVRSDFRDQFLADMSAREIDSISEQNRKLYARLLADLALKGGQLQIEDIVVEVEIDE